MKIFFDTEFYEDGKTIELISIGMVREDGKEYYAETISGGWSANKDPWLIENVLPYLHLPYEEKKTREQIAKETVEFVGENPEFWAYYADYDWVVFCQLFGRMIDLPQGFPMLCRDIKQLHLELGSPMLPKQTGSEHNALDDALWNKKAYESVRNYEEYISIKH